MGRDPWAKSGVVFVFGIVSSMSHTTSWEAVDLQIRKMESWRARRRRRRKLASPTQHWSHHWKSCLGKPRAWTYRGGPDVPPCSLDAKSCVLSPACISRIVSFEAELFANSFDIVQVLLGPRPYQLSDRHLCPVRTALISPWRHGSQCNGIETQP